MDKQTAAAGGKPRPSEVGKAGIGPGHKRLQAFIGTWKLEGRQLQSLVGPAADITGMDRYEWLTGGFFLVHHFYAHVGEDTAACIEMTGYDSYTGSYPMHTFYNNGQTKTWTAEERDGTWTITGEWEIGGNPLTVRCTVLFNNEGRVRTDRWEYAAESGWHTFWEVVATRS